MRHTYLSETFWTPTHKKLEDSEYSFILVDANNRIIFKKYSRELVDVLLDKTYYINHSEEFFKRAL